MNINFPEKSQIPSLRSLFKEVFGDSDTVVNSFFTTAFSESRCMCATLKNQVVASLYWFDCAVNGQKIAYIYAVATKKEQRNKGICGALMEKTHNVLKENGYFGAILVPSNAELFTFYEKFGYKTSCFNETFYVSAASEGIDVEQISAEEFALLRKEFLPPNSVIQEKENIDFLKEFALFFKGENFLFAAEVRKNTIYCNEILGTTEAAPKILKTLNFENGTFKTFGNETPFAMFLKFKETATTPNYFAFAFE